MWDCIVNRCEHSSNVLLLLVHRADLHLTSPSARLQPTLQHHGYGLVYHVMCLFIPQLSLGTHAAYTQRAGSGWVDLSAWLCTEVVCRSKDIHVLAWRKETALCKTYVLPLYHNSTGRQPVSVVGGLVGWCVVFRAGSSAAASEHRSSVGRPWQHVTDGCKCRSHLITWSLYTLHYCRRCYLYSTDSVSSSTALDS